MFRFLLFAGTAVAASAQAPLVYNRAVYNAASFMPAGVPGGAIARGAIFTIFGARLGPSSGIRASAYPLSNSLSNVALTVTQGSTTVNAIPVYVSASQINAIMPSNAPLGAVSLQVIYNNLRSNLAPVRVANSALGIFTVSGAGLGPGILQNYIAADNQPINSPTVTAQNGQTITLWGTGLGPVTGGDNVAPPSGNLPAPVQVSVGGKLAQVLYSGRTPCCAGTDQIVFTVPDDAPAGCWVPVGVRVGGTTYSNVVTMAIQPAGGACSNDVLPQISDTLIRGGKVGRAISVRGTTRQDIGTRAPIDATADYHVSFALNFNGSPFAFNPLLSSPPAGTCTSYTAPGDLLAGDLLPGAMPQATPLDFGAPFLLTGPRGSKTLTSFVSGYRAGYLGGSISNNILPNSLFLEPGPYVLRGFGGIDIGPFSASFSVPQPVTWVNRDQTNAINRSQPLTISWSGGDSGQMILIAGYGVDLPTNSSAVFACVAPANAQSFTVPVSALANLPATRGNPLQSKDVLYLGTLPAASVQNLNASGLDQGLALFSHINGKTVVIQ